MLDDAVGDVSGGQDDAGAEADFAVLVIHLKAAEGQFKIDARQEFRAGGAAFGPGFVGDEGVDAQQEQVVAFLAGAHVEVPERIVAVEATEERRTAAHAVVIPLLFVEVSRKKGQRGFFGEFGIRGLVRWLFHDETSLQHGV